MTKINYNQKYLEMIEEALASYLPNENCLEGDLSKAMKYSLLDGGKRIRPILALEFCRLCGGDIENALPFACAVEMVHTYSLIHDDLPCMDDDDMRRGKAANHIANGEDIALLAGDALLSLAFETMLSAKAVAKVGAQKAAQAAYELAKASGAAGMVGGQVIDLQHENKTVTVDILQQMDMKKTGALIIAAAKMGCIAAGADDIKIIAAHTYACAVGLAFQIVDDILDLTADSRELGKPVGSDITNKKSTYVSLLGLKQSQALVDELTKQSIDALHVFDNDTSFLTELSLSLASRKK